MNQSIYNRLIEHSIELRDINFQLLRMDVFYIETIGLNDT